MAGETVSSVMLISMIEIICSRGHHIPMRTTLNLDDDILREAGLRAKLLKTSLGKAVSDLARLGLQAAPPMKQEGGFTIFDPPEGSPKISMRKVKDALSDFP